jgi:hypothetical protein
MVLYELLICCFCRQSVALKMILAFGLSERTAEVVTRQTRCNYIRSKHYERILRNRPKLDCMLESLRRKTIVSCGSIVSEFADSRAFNDKSNVKH